MKIGYAEGECPRCGKILHKRRPADVTVCDCYRYCPLCGAEMTPYTPDLTTITNEPDKGLEVFFVCNNHAPPYYSKQKPIEMRLS